MEAMQRYLERAQTDRIVTLDLTVEEAMAVTAALACFGYCVDGEREVVEESYMPPTEEDYGAFGLRKTEAEVTDRLHGHITSILRYLRARDPDWIAFKRHVKAE